MTFSIACLLLLSAAALVPQPALALPDLWQKFFGEEETGPRPEETLVAPFAEPGAESAKAPKNSLDSLYKGAEGEGEQLMNPDVPHRHPQQIAAWLTEAISEIVSIENESLDAHMRGLDILMNETARNEFRDFLDKSRISETLRANNLNLHGFVEGQPLLLNKGAVSGRYRWLLETPVALTFLPANAKNYDKSKPVTQYIQVRTQVGRVDAGQGRDELIIESFSATKSAAHQ